jgi:extracellular factor (EF) 3-hydroxypalmitic acid methyl ester biosynthesis protein
MLTKIYDKRTATRGLGGYLDTVMLDWPLARAVRARMEAIRDFLVEEVQDRSGVVRVMDIACGPCREYLAWPTSRIAGSVEAVVMDNDPLALDYVAREVVPALPGKIRLQPTRYNALRTRSSQATIKKFGKFDIIYSVGLFDYLPDDQLIAILAGLRDTLSDGGVMYIAFKDTEQYDQTWYQWHLDWFFFQRTHEDCLRLFQEAGMELDAESRDQTGIIMNFISRAARRTIVRVDSAEDILGPLAPHVPSSTAVAPNE